MKCNMGKQLVFHILTGFLPTKMGKAKRKQDLKNERKCLVLPKVDFFNEIIVYAHLRI